MKNNTKEKIEHSEKEKELIQSAEAMGGLKMIQGVAHFLLDSALIHSVEAVEANKSWKGLYASFGDFLDNNPFLPFRREKFYELSKALRATGDKKFDWMIGLKIPAKTILQLKAIGTDMELDEERDEIVVTTEDNKTRIPNERRAVRELLKQVKFELSERDRQTRKQEKENEKLRKAIDEKERQIANLKNTNTVDMLNVNGDLLDARLALTKAYDHLIAECKKLGPEDKDKFYEPLIQTIGNLDHELRIALRTERRVAEAIPKKLVGDSFDDCMNNYFDSMDMTTISDVIEEANDDELSKLMKP